MKNLFRALILMPQIIVAADALYSYVSAIDDDPEVIAVWQTVKSNSTIAAHAAVIRTQYETLVGLIKQLKK
jgi:hypothetical protein